MSARRSESLCLDGRCRPGSEAPRLPRHLAALVRASFSAAVMLVALISGAQVVPGIPKECRSKKVDFPADTLDLIVSHYFAGKEDELRCEVSKILDGIKDSKLTDEFCKSNSPDASGGNDTGNNVSEDRDGDVVLRWVKAVCDTAPNFSVDTVSIVIITKSRSDEGEIIRFFFDDPYGTHLHGAESIWEVFLASGEDTVLQTSYVSTRKRNPIIKKIPGFVRLFDLGAVAGLFTLSEGADTPTPPISVTISRLDLPFSRGTVVITDEAQVLPRISKEKACKIRKRSTKLLEELGTRQGQISLCPDLVARKIYDSIDKELVNIAGMSAGSPALVSNQWKALAGAVSDGADEAFGSPACTVDFPPASPSEVAGLEAAFQVEEQLTEVVMVHKTEKASGKFSYENVPLSRFGLLVMAGILVDADDADRVKLDSGKLAVDPLSGTMVALAVNIHPWKFDPVSSKMTAAERFRVFLGASFSPELGLIGGVGVGLVRGLSVNIGLGAMRVNVVRKGDEIGQEPADPANPFESEMIRVGFAGLGYNF